MLPKYFHLDCSPLELLEGALPRKAKNKIETCPVLRPSASQVRRQGLGLQLGGPLRGPRAGWGCPGDSSQRRKGAEGVTPSLSRPGCSCPEISHSSQERRNLHSDSPSQGYTLGQGSGPVLCTTLGAQGFSTLLSDQEQTSDSSVWVVVPLHQHYQSKCQRGRFLLVPSPSTLSD